MKGKILVVDDEETMRLTLADILRLEGFQVQTLSNGKSAIEALRIETYDLLLLDLKMPGVDGLEVLRNASKIAPDMMVILLTAHGSLESAIEALRQDVYDYLLKPASPQQIIKSVMAAMAQRTDLLRKRKILAQLDSSLQELKDTEWKEPAAPLDSGYQVSGNIRYDPTRRLVWMEGDQSIRVYLTPAEGRLFQVLLENRPDLMLHRQLVLQVQGYEVLNWEAPEVLRPVVSRLRRKLSRFPGGGKWIVSVRGSGYLLDLE